MNLTPTHESYEYLFIINPALDADYASPRFNWSLKSDLDFRRYTNNKNLNAEFWRGFNLGAGYTVSRRSNLKTGISYLAEKVVLPEPEITGLSTALTDQKVYSLSGTFSHQLSERSGLDFTVTYSGSEYDLAQYVDTRFGSAGLGYRRELATQRSKISINSGYSFNESRETRVDSYRLTLGWSLLYSETIDLSASLGGRYSRIKNKESQPSATGSGLQENSGILIDVSLRKRGKNYSTHLGYNRDLSLSSLGEPVGTHKIYGGGELTVSEKLEFLISAHLQYVKTLAANLQTDSRYFQVAPGLHYRITDNGIVQAFYAYTGSKDFLLIGGNEILRHQVTFSWALTRAKNSYRIEYIFSGIKDYTLVGDNLIERHRVLLSWTYRFMNG
ncbi:MAG: hypothetical protein JRD68_09045 [Deltaproteobacteria bacterium]|nr:hypothetical protein [Deltaproteobacteria bacterium]